VTPPTQKGVTGGEEPIVFIVGDDTSLREALRSPFSHCRPAHRVFRLGSRIAANKLPDVPAWLSLDVRLPSVTPA